METGKHKPRESHDLGKGAVILLYDKVKKYVILVKQFRKHNYHNGNKDDLMIEACHQQVDQIKNTRDSTSVYLKSE